MREATREERRQTQPACRGSCRDLYSVGNTKLGNSERYVGCSREGNNGEGKMNLDLLTVPSDFSS